MGAAAPGWAYPAQRCPDVVLRSPEVWGAGTPAERVGTKTMSPQEGKGQRPGAMSRDELQHPRPLSSTEPHPALAAGGGTSHRKVLASHMPNHRTAVLPPSPQPCPMVPAGQRGSC